MADTTTAGLLAHAEQVCAAVLGSAASAAVSVSVHIAGEDVPGHFPATHEYMVALDFSKAPQLIAQARPRLESFLGKRVLSQETHSPLYLSWGEGYPLASTPVATTPEPIRPLVSEPPAQSQLDGIEWMKTDTSLPLWLEALIFERLGARHEPNWQRFGYNLDLTEDEIKVYLGTYFPRSYAEAFCILDALFEHSEYGTSWKQKTEAAILDVGTGTGGNIVGLLTALAKHCPNLQRVTVHGYDGSNLALSVVREILQAFASKVPFALEVKLAEHLITGSTDLPSPPTGSYDFITTFKTGCEIISRIGCSAEDFYCRFLQAYAGLLTNIGLMILLDVTTKPDHGDYYPQLLNEQVTRFIRERPEFATIVPAPCHFYEARCSESCFTQKEFAVTHRMANHDLSRVAYRVIARASCAKPLHATTERAAEYVISSRRAKDTLSTCPHSSGRGEPLDGYRVGASLRNR